MSGTYYVAVTSGTCPVLAGTYVWVKLAPTLTVTSSVNPSCPGANVTLSVASAGSASSYTWSTGSNAVTTQISPTVTTSYTVSASNNTCVTTAALTQSVTFCNGLDDLPASHAELSVYPNPFKGEFRVKTQVTVSVSIYNILGELVYEGIVHDNDVVNTESLPPGIYRLKMREESGSKTISIIKN
jgi:hypothetical protein